MRRGEGLRVVELWWKTNESCEGEEGYNAGGTGGKDGDIWDCKKGEAGEDKLHKTFILLWPLRFHF